MKVYVNGEKYEEVLVEIVVEQKSFYVPLHKLMKFPESYFSVALKPHWRYKDSDSDVNDEQILKLIVTDRSASLFRLIAMYLEFGEVPRDKHGECLFDSRLLDLLREEADYYCLSRLVSELDVLLKIKAVALIEAKKNVCDEIQLPEGCVVGRDLPWFESEDTKTGISFWRIRRQCDEGINTACSFDYVCCDYEIIVDSVNQSHSNSFDNVNNSNMYVHNEASGDVNFLPCFKELKDHYGKAKLEITEGYNNLLTSSCFIGLSIVPYKYKLKLIQLQYISPEGTWTIDDEEGVSESEAAIGYVIVQRKSEECRGGKLLLNREDGWEGYDSVVCFYGPDKHEFTTLTSGDQRVLVFAIVPGTSKFPEWHYHVHCSCPQMSMEDSYIYFIKCLFSHINNRFVIGLYTEHYYSDTHENYTTLSTDTVKSNDKLLVQFAQATNIPISLVYVRGYEDGTIRILDSPSHTLHDCHKNVNNIQFVTLSWSSIYRLDSKQYWNKKFETKKNIFYPFIVAAFIVGQIDAF